jgi:hypothetical protein
MGQEVPRSVRPAVDGVRTPRCSPFSPQRCSFRPFPSRVYRIHPQECIVLHRAPLVKSSLCLQVPSTFLSTKPSPLRLRQISSDNGIHFLSILLWQYGCCYCNHFHKFVLSLLRFYNSHAGRGTLRSVFPAAFPNIAC